MATNPNIALGVQPLQIPNALANYAQFAQIQKYTQDVENENKLNTAMANSINKDTGEIDVNTLRKEVAGAGIASQLPKIEKNLLEGRELKNKVSKGELELQRAQTDESMRNIASYETVADALTHIQEELATKKITPQQAQQFQKMLPADDAGMPKFQVAMFRRALNAKDFLDNQIQEKRVGLEEKRVGLEGQRVGLEGQRVGLEGRRVGLAEEEARLKREGIEGVSPKELQKREAALPAATAAIKGFDAKSNSFIKDLEALRDHPGLNQITGVAAGRLPAVTSEGRAAQALYDKIVAKGGFQALQDLRDASKTGGALGNVSNQEGKQLSSSFAAIQRTQDAKDVRAAIDQAIGDIEGAKTRTREAYDATYSYRRPAAGGAATTPIAPAAGNVIDFGSLK